MNPEIFKKGRVTPQNSLVLKYCSILDFNSEYFIPEIEIMGFNLPHVYILGGDHCAGKRHDFF